MYKIIEEPIESSALQSQVLKEYNGAVVTFSGVVRNHSGDTPTDHLVYEAYEKMAERSMAEIGEEAKSRWGIDDVAVLHRVGRLEIGEISVLVAVGSPHRDEAFQACRFIIDRLKESVPIWKKEVGEDGSFWLEGPRPAFGKV